MWIVDGDADYFVFQFVYLAIEWADNCGKDRLEVKVELSVCFCAKAKHISTNFHVYPSVNNFSLTLNKRAMMALGRSPEYHWNQIISKSVHRFNKGRRLKAFFYL